jgi:hypothetical protein
MPKINNAQRMELVMEVYRAVFAARLENQLEDLNNSAGAISARWSIYILNIRGRLFKNSTIPGFDISLNIGDTNQDGTLKPLRLRFIAQNPDKRDGNGNLKENAILALQGHKIMWVINQDIANGFLGKVMDDQWYPSTQRATYPANQNTNHPNPRHGVDQTGQTHNMNKGDWVSELPDVNQGEVADHIIEMLGADECDFIIE